MTELSKRTVPRWAANGPLMLAGLEAAIDRIGSCFILGHSQGGGLALHATLSHRQVHAVVLLEPHGVPGSFDPAQVAGRSCLTIMGDFIDEAAEWHTLDEQAKRAHRSWNEAGGTSWLMELPQRGIKGNSHMLMMDNNSDQVAGLVLEWLDGEKAAGRLM
ncbi:pimeloyl-ACP methyl ester carboxylesterase [Rhodoligotrophos appendicifer]|uniref:hypothetical protein n=1 Tax=Rhodoligotrophos appendicifer TaxID=987056 RepID=UPI001960D0BB|nr:hypothetical protein [Rhodoligotrophos appendicifer]